VLVEGQALELLAVKMAVEELTPESVAAATGVLETDIRAAVAECVKGRPGVGAGSNRAMSR
jgi:anaerobic selenocysteine-containing dehydrogenase